MPEPAGTGSSRGSLALDDLVALNDEIAALVRTGLPLERGLTEVGGEFSGRLGRTMTALAERMSQGATLPEALAAERERLPRIYRAVVEAGLRAGRLATALESLTGFVRAYLDSRRSIGVALCYPLLVLVLAYGLFVLLVVHVVPRFLSAFDTFRIPVPAALSELGWLGETAVYWGALLPVLLACGIAFWGWTGTSAGFRQGRTWALLRIFPWMRGLLRQNEAANFADMLGLLVEHGVPYPEALVLATEASGDRRLIQLGQALAASVERGDSPAGAIGHGRALPPLLGWLLATGQNQAGLAGSLRAMAAIYRKQAEHQAEKIRVYLPIVLLVGIGLSATLLFGLALFLPFTSLLKDLAIAE
jgi:type II secretory pathway component PulF